MASIKGLTQQHRTEKVIFIEGDEISQMLHDMVENPKLHTPSSEIKLDGGERITLSFYDKHRDYLTLHPKVNPSHYLANLRTMIKTR